MSSPAAPPQPPRRWQGAPVANTFDHRSGSPTPPALAIASGSGGGGRQTNGAYTDDGKSHPFGEPRPWSSKAVPIEERPTFEVWRGAEQNGAEQNGAEQIVKPFRDKDDTAAGAIVEANNGKEANDVDALFKTGRDPNEKVIVEQRVALIVDKFGFNLFVVVLAFLNAFVIGLELNTGGLESDMSSRLAWFMFDLLFSAWFILELGIRIKSQRKHFFLDVWNDLDLLIVIGSVLDVLLLRPAGLPAGGKIRPFTSLRTLRAVRLVRLVRMFPFFRELWLLVGGLGGSMRALGWTSGILLLILYVCSVVVTTEIGQNEEVYGAGPSYDGEVWPYEEYFGSVWRSMFTLLQVLTLDGWSDDIVRHIAYFRPAMAVFFVVYLLFTAFGLMNVVIGIIVENTLTAAGVANTRIQEEQERKRKSSLGRLQLVLELSDHKRSGSISLAEIRAAAQSRTVQTHFEILGISIEDVEKLFNLLDFDRSGSVDLKRFVVSCKELVGGARKRDIAQVEITVGTLTQRLDSLDSRFASIEGELGALSAMTDDFVQNTVRLLTGFDGTQKKLGA